MRYRARRADGAYRWMTSRAEPMHGQDGRIVQWYGLCQDIDDQMHAEEAVRQSERQLQELVDALPINILSFAPSGEITYASKRYLDRVGPPPPHIENFNMLAQALAHPDDFPEMFSRASNGFATGQPFVNRFRRRDRQGIYRWIEARAQPLRDASGAVVQWYIISIDIEEERRAQDELRIARENLARQSQAASLAELSASIAHEVNQPLAAIVANSHACQRWLSAEPPNVERGQKTVARIIRDANSAADVVSRVRALFKQSMDTHVHAEIGDVIAQVRDLIAEEASRHHVRVQIDIDDSLPIIPLDGVQIQQVLINLIRNGIEAMTGMPGDRVLGLHVHEFENSIRVEIRDRGEGIKFPDKIFEPFFTTKDHGMGMGLAICRSIVESHGGRLWAEKNEPLGSAFIFTLPIPADPVS
jgi:PAS domain S-box-containing protein